MKQETPPRQVIFDPTPEIFATNHQGGFTFPLTAGGVAAVDTHEYDEVRLVVSAWHPSGQRGIELDRAYIELRGAFDPAEEHWATLAEIEPVVPPYGAESFDGWIVLPIFAAQTRLVIMGSGFEPRARLQVRAVAYLVA